MVFVRVAVEGSPSLIRFVGLVVVVGVAGTGAVGAAPGVVELASVVGECVGRAVVVGVAPAVVGCAVRVVVVGVVGAGAIGAAPGVIGLGSVVAAVVW